MSNAVFPALKGLGFPVDKEARFSTSEQVAESGRKKGIGHWLYPVWTLTLPFNYLRDGLDGYEEMKTLMGFFLSRRGKLDSFLFDDPDDHFVTGKQLLGTGDGQTTQFQALRSFGGFLEPVKDLKTSPAPKVYLNDILQESGYTIGYLNSGLVTFTPAPGAGVTVKLGDYGYYWRCHFLEDVMNVSKFLKQVWKTQSLKIETKK